MMPLFAQFAFLSARPYNSRQQVTKEDEPHRQDEQQRQREPRDKFSVVGPAEPAEPIDRQADGQQVTGLEKPDQGIQSLAGIHGIIWQLGIQLIGTQSRLAATQTELADTKKQLAEAEQRLIQKDQQLAKYKKKDEERREANNRRQKEYQSRLGDAYREKKRLEMQERRKGSKQESGGPGTQGGSTRG